LLPSFSADPNATFLPAAARADLESGNRVTLRRAK
jgi:hypothetical protein